MEITAVAGVVAGAVLVLLAVVAVMVAAVFLVPIVRRRKDWRRKMDKSLLATERKEDRMHEIRSKKTIGVCDAKNRCQTAPPPLDVVHPHKVNLEWFEAFRGHDALERFVDAQAQILLIPPDAGVELHQLRCQAARRRST